MEETQDVFKKTLATQELEENRTEIEEVILYPNPVTQGFLTIKVSPKVGHMKQIELVSQLGQSLKNYQLNDTSISIDLRGIPTGLYFVKINTTEKVIIKKIVIE